MLQLISQLPTDEEEQDTVPQSLLNQVANGHLAKQLRHHHARKRSVKREQQGAQTGEAYSAAMDPCDLSIRTELIERAINTLAELDDLQRQIISLRFLKTDT